MNNQNNSSVIRHREYMNQPETGIPNKKKAIIRLNKGLKSTRHWGQCHREILIIVLPIINYLCKVSSIYP